MSRPIAIDMTGITHIVTDGTLRDRLQALDRRLGAGPVDDPQWLLERGYAYGQVPRFSIAVHKNDFSESDAQGRILAAVRTILSPECEWIVERDRLAQLHADYDHALASINAIAREWLHSGPRFWCLQAGAFGAPVRFNPQGEGPRERWIHCAVPHEVIDHVFADTVHVAHLVRENGNRKWNVRFGLPQGCEVNLDQPIDDLTRLRILSEMPSALLPRRAA